MDTIQEAIKIAMEMFRYEYGEDEKLDDGDEFATVFPDGILIFRLDDNELKIKIIAGKPYYSDFNLNLLKE